MRRWWTQLSGDIVLRRLLKNTAYLLSADAVVALLGILSLALMARALGPIGLGILALIEAYAKLIDRLVRFEPWQAVVRYGAAALEEGREEDFRRLIKCSTLFDVFGASLSALVAIFGLIIASNWLGFDKEQTRMAVLFSSVLVISLSSTPTAILRLFDRFNIVAQLAIGVAVLRLLLTLTAWHWGGDIWSFILIMMIYQSIEQLSPLVLAWRELRRRGHANVWGVSIRGLLRQNPRILEFLWNSNINVLARASTQRLDTLIVGAMLGAADTGLYQLAKRVGLAGLRLGRPTQQAIYPDVARLWVRGEIARMRKTVLHLMVLVGAVATVGLLIAAVNMTWLVRFFFGEQFVAAAPMVTVQAIAVVLFLSGNGLIPALLSMGADRALAGMTFLATIVFFAAIVPLIHLFGAMGASISHVVFNLTWLFGCCGVFLFLTRHGVRR